MAQIDRTADLLHDRWRNAGYPEPCRSSGYDLEEEMDKLAELVAARAIEKRQKAEAFYNASPGLHGTIDAVLRIVAWAMSHRQLPSVHAFMDRWGMSRATAYRYRARLTNCGLTPRSH